MPHLSASEWNSSTGSLRASRTATLPPCCAMALQIANPMPLPPPVTRMLRSFKLRRSEVLLSLIFCRAEVDDENCLVAVKLVSR